MGVSHTVLNKGGGWYILESGVDSGQTDILFTEKKSLQTYLS